MADIKLLEKYNLEHGLPEIKVYNRVGEIKRVRYFFAIILP